MPDIPHIGPMHYISDTGSTCLELASILQDFSKKLFLQSRMIAFFFPLSKNQYVVFFWLLCLFSLCWHPSEKGTIVGLGANLIRFSKNKPKLNGHIFVVNVVTTYY